MKVVKKHVCGACGAEMVSRLVGPCLDCGGNPKEVEECLCGEHTYGAVDLFGGELLCDFCDADMPSTDPLFWGFPERFDWDVGLRQERYERHEGLKPKEEFACSHCHNTLRKQRFIIKNAQRSHVELPKKYWPFV